MPFTKKGKAVVKERNASENDGKNRCENCGVETVPARQHEKNVTPPANEAHVDHVVPKAKGGEGEPDNGQGVKTMPDMRDGNWTRVVVALEKDEDDYPRADYENLWTLPVGNGLF